MGDKGAREMEEDDMEQNNEGAAVFDFGDSDFGFPQKEKENSNSKCVIFGVDLSEGKGRRYQNVENVGSSSKNKNSAAEKGKAKVDDEEKMNLDLDLGLTESEAEDRKHTETDFLKVLSANNNIDHAPMEVWNQAVLFGPAEYIRKSHRVTADSYALRLEREVGSKELSSKSSLNTKKDVALKNVDMSLKKNKTRNWSLHAGKMRKDDKDSPSSCMTPSLVELCLHTLSKNHTAITSLKYVPDILRHKLTKLVCDSRKMDAHFLKLLVEESPSEIRVYNSSSLTEEKFTEIFDNCDTKNLIVLQLDLCGSCISDHVLQCTLARSSNGLPALVTLSLNGAYRLSDMGLYALTMSAPALQSINLSQCSLLTSDGISNLARHFEYTLKELYLDDCQDINPMNILPALKKLKCLEVLSVAGIHTISDDFVIEIVEACGQNIKELVFADCLNLTDDSLKAVGENCSGLCALDLSSLCKLTDSSMIYLANACRSINRLKLRRNIGFSDEAIAAFLETCGSCLTELSLNHCNSVGSNTALALAKCSKNLLNLDLSWCRNLTDEILEMIVGDCTSLRELKLFGCTHITDELLRAHSNKQLEIIGLQMSATISKRVNVFEPQVCLLHHSPIKEKDDYCSLNKSFT